MEVVKIKGDENSALLELRGESFTLATLIEEELWENKNVVEAASFREHPYLSEVKLWIRTNGVDFREVLEETTEKLIKKVNELKKEFKAI